MRASLTGKDVWPREGTLGRRDKSGCESFHSRWQSLGSARSVPAMERELLCYCWARFVFRRCIVKRETKSLATAVFVLVSLRLMLAQDTQTQPSPVLPSSIL